MDVVSVYLWCIHSIIYVLQKCLNNYQKNTLLNIHVHKRFCLLITIVNNQLLNQLLNYNLFTFKSVVKKVNQHHKTFESILQIKTNSGAKCVKVSPF